MASIFIFGCRLLPWYLLHFGAVWASAEVWLNAAPLGDKAETPNLYRLTVELAQGGNVSHAQVQIGVAVLRVERGRGFDAINVRDRRHGFQPYVAVDAAQGPVVSPSASASPRYACAPGRRGWSPPDRLL
jgi:hypothetical protein